MYFINPFRALRPNKKNASSVAVASTDHLGEDGKKNHLKKNPWSYLNVFDASNESKSKKQFELMKEKSILQKDDSSSFYIYKISDQNHQQVGIIGTAKLSAYDNLHIRGHEEIFLERAQRRLKQMDNLNAQIGPIYTIYPDNEQQQLLKKEILSAPIYSFEAIDKCKHEIWILNQKEKIQKICDYLILLIEFILQIATIEWKLCQNFQNMKASKSKSYW